MASWKGSGLEQGRSPEAGEKGKENNTRSNRKKEDGVPMLREEEGCPEPGSIGGSLPMLREEERCPEPGFRGFTADVEGQKVVP